MSQLIEIPTLDQLAAEPTLALKLPPEVLAALASRCVVAHSAIVNVQTARLLGRNVPRDEVTGGDRLLDLAEAITRTGLSKDQLYRRELPFKVKVGPRQLRFSAHGIEQWIAARTR